MTKLQWCGAALVMVAAVGALLQGQQRPYDQVLPLDQAVRRQGLVRYREQLLAEVKRRNLDGVLSRLSPNVRTDPSSTAVGIGAVKRSWKLPAERHSFFEALEEILLGGGRLYDNGTFVAPYVHTEFASEDVHDFVIVTQKNVPLHISPDASARTLMLVDFAALRYEPGEVGWLRVFLKDGRSAYVQDRFTRFAAGPYAHFSVERGSWRVTVLGQVSD